MLNEETAIDFAFALSVLKRLTPDIKQEHIALLAAVFAAAREGHLVLDISDGRFDAVLETLPEGVIVKDPKEDCPKAWICRWGNYLYLQKNWVYESQILFHLQRLAKASPTIPLAFTYDSTLNAMQNKAVQMSATHCLAMLTGGPGTGKTFTVAALVKACLYSQGNCRIIVTAPTGKAVAQLEGSLRKKMEGRGEIRAGTLHAILGLKETVREERIEPLHADVIIVDECSMIDAPIFSKLLASVPEGTRLLLIGDKDQLPPVESGSVFADLIDAAVFPKLQLTEVLRSDRAELLSFAAAIRERKEEEVISQISPLPSPTDVWEKCKERFPSFSFEEPQAQELLEKLSNFTILSCMRRGPLGVDALNRLFLDQYLKSAVGTWWTLPIIVTCNDYDLELFNGDLGCLLRKMQPHFSLRELHFADYALFYDPEGKPRQIPALALKKFEFAYALSVHKSQGSEYDEVLVLAADGAEVFGREVLYTAVTRARHKVELASSPTLLSECIRTSSRKKSGICARLG